MNFKKLIEKIASGEAVSAGELEELRQYDPEVLQKAISTLKKELAELNDSNQSETGRLLNELKMITADRDTLSEKLSALSRRNRIEEIARTSGCEEIDYLDFLCSKAEIDLADQAAVDALIGELKTTHPGCFASQLKSGGGAGIADPENPVGVVSATTDSGADDRLSKIIFHLGQVPFEE